MAKLWRADEVLSEKDLVLPGITPANLKLGGRYKATMITSDMFNICERLAELNPRLEVHLLEDTQTGEHGYSITERVSEDRIEHVLTVKELDNRAVEQIQYFMKVPFEQRFAQSQKAMEKYEAGERQRELDELYEQLGQAFWYQLEHDGFIETRGKSYPKRGVKPRD